MEVHEPVRLLGVVLGATFLFVHDDAAMARGEAWVALVYKGNAHLSPANSNT